MIRLRLHFSKIGKIRFISHRDMARIWERAFRRAEIGVAYSEGFSPRPKFSFGLALATGYESEAEYLDVDLNGHVDLNKEDCVDGLCKRLKAVLPEGIDLLAVGVVDRSLGSLQQVVDICTWHIEIDGITKNKLAKWVHEVLSSNELVVQRERKGKLVNDDIRPQIVSLENIEEVSNGVRLVADLATKPRALRPSELLTAVDPPLEAHKVRRISQWVLQGKERIEPLTFANFSPLLAE
tara:strand:+ start:1055 stop:1768 length:714 start_codon:yes stop_codon:yes gene_type:complete